jgi:putative transposase
VHEDLAEAGHRVGRKRVARLMRADGLAGVSRRWRPPRATPRAPETPPAPDLVRRDVSDRSAGRMIGDAVGAYRGVASSML